MKSDNLVVYSLSILRFQISSVSTPFFVVYLLAVSFPVHEVHSMGGRAAAAKMTAAERSARARYAVGVRHGTIKKKSAGRGGKRQSRPWLDPAVLKGAA